MATAYHPKIVSPGIGDRQKVEHALESASETWVAGNLLIHSQNDSGYVTEATGAANELVAGLALADASGVTGTAVAYELMYPGAEVEFSTWDVSDGALTAASNFTRGVGYSMVENGSSVHVIDHDDTAPGIWVYSHAVPTHDDSTSYRGVFRLAIAAASATPVGAAATAGDTT